jgi:hypothetical protein
MITGGALSRPRVALEHNVMAGRLRSSFRSGNLAEHLGLLLLKGIAAVADVPRTEDVGLDAIASLLRRDEDGNCYADSLETR